MKKIIIIFILFFVFAFCTAFSQEQKQKKIEENLEEFVSKSPSELLRHIQKIAEEIASPNRKRIKEIDAELQIIAEEVVVMEIQVKELVAAREDIKESILGEKLGIEKNFQGNAKNHALVRLANHAKEQLNWYDTQIKDLRNDQVAAEQERRHLRMEKAQLILDGKLAKRTGGRKYKRRYGDKELRPEVKPISPGEVEKAKSFLNSLEKKDQKK